MRWRTIPGHKNYEVSSTGIVRRRTPGRGTYPGRVLTATASPNGYRYVCLDQTWCAVHQLVCRAFHGRRPSPRHEVGHRNRKKIDNRARNLRWLTKEQNEADKKKHGTWVVGTRHHNATLTPAKVRRIRALSKRGALQEDLAARFGVLQSNVSKIINRKAWKHVK